MRPVRILHLINSLAQGGAERVLSRLLAETVHDSQQQHKAVTLLDAGHFAAEVEAAGVEVTELGLARARIDPAGAGAAVGLIRRRCPDVLVCWLYQSCVVGTAAKLVLPRTRLIWNIRGTAKNPTEATRSQRLSVRALAATSSVPWAIAVNSRAGRSDHEALGLRARRWAYVPNGFDPDEWVPGAGDRVAARRELGVTDATTVFVMVARAEPQKDHTNLLRAFEQLAGERADVHLMLIGRGTELLTPPPELKSHVSLLGSRDDVGRWLAASDVGVLSSAYGEGLPNAVAEKMLSGLPCITTDTGDCRLLLGDTGLLVPASDPAALAAGMKRYATMASSERKLRGARARARVEARYSMGAMVAGFTRLWEDLYEPEPGRPHRR